MSEPEVPDPRPPMGPQPPRQDEALNAHRGQLQWAASVMAREIELHYVSRGDAMMDGHTVQVLARYLREIASGDRDPWGLLQ